MRICCAFIAIAWIAIYAGCGESSGSATSTDAESAARPAAKVPQKPDHPVPSAPPKKGRLSKLVVKDLERGVGPVAHWGDEVAVRYVGLVYQTGKIYSQHWDSSLVFKLDGESFGSGWQRSIEGMRVGGRREALIPARFLLKGQDVAYVLALVKARPRWKRRSFKQKGPFSTITVRKGDDRLRIVPPDRPAPKRILVRDLEEGSGPAAKPGDEVSARYVGAAYGTGEIQYGGTTRLFQLGSGELGEEVEESIDNLGEAFEDGLEGLKPGGRREVIIPSRLLGGSGAIDYVIELTRLKPAAGPQ